VPIVRTFTPILAGVAGMRYRRFVVYNVIGAAAWASAATLLGYSLGRRFPGIERWLTPIFVAVIAVSVLPVALEVFRGRRSRSPARSTVEVEPIGDLAEHHLTGSPEQVS
jgi:membrane-associated protein